MLLRMAEVSNRYWSGGDYVCPRQCLFARVALDSSSCACNSFSYNDSNFLMVSDIMSLDRSVSSLSEYLKFNLRLIDRSVINTYKSLIFPDDLKITSTTSINLYCRSLHSYYFIIVVPSLNFSTNLTR